GAPQRHAVRLGIERRNGHGYLVDGTVVSYHLASSIIALYRRRILESRCPPWDLRNPNGRQHRLSLARIPQLRRVDSFHWLLHDCFLGSVNVPVPSRRSDLNHPMVSARCVSLVSVVVPGCADHAFCFGGATRVA